MFPYIALIMFPPIISVFGLILKQRNHNVNTSNCGKSTIPIFFIMLFFMLALRNECIGRDLERYKIYFERGEIQDLIYVFNTWKECLFRLYNWSVYRITSNFQVYLAITAFITVFPIAYVYSKDREHAFLKIIVFVNMSTFIMLFSGLRQSIAMAIGMLAYLCVKNKRKIGFIILAVVASLIHHTGFMVFFMYPIYYMKLKRKYLVFVFALVGVTYVFNTQIFEFLTKILSSTSEKYEAITSSTGAYGSLVLFSLFAMLSYVISDEKVIDAEALGLRNFLVFAVLLQCFAPIHTLAMRMNYYYILFIPIALGKCLCCRRDGMKNIAYISEIVICVFFTILFVYNTYNSYITGISTLDTIPYLFFWQ